jgi:hypothetical protein
MRGLSGLLKMEASLTGGTSAEQIAGGKGRAKDKRLEILGAVEQHRPSDSQKSL